MKENNNKLEKDVNAVLKEEQVKNQENHVENIDVRYTLKHYLNI